MEEIKFEDLVKLSGIKDFNKQAYDIAFSAKLEGIDKYNKVLHTMHVAEFLKRLEKPEAMFMCAEICSSWDDPKDILEIRVVYELMKKNQFDPSIEYVIDDMHGTDRRGGYILGSAYRVAREEGVEFKGSEYFNGMPKSDSFDKRYAKKYLAGAEQAQTLIDESQPN